MKNTSIAENMTLLKAPIPNHSTNSGARAIFGSVYSDTMNGSNRSPSRFTHPRMKPISPPATLPMTKPNPASNSVSRRSDHRSPEAAQR